MLGQRKEKGNNQQRNNVNLYTILYKFWNPLEDLLHFHSSDECSVSV